MLCSMNVVSVVETQIPPQVHVYLNDKVSISSRSSKYGVDEISQPLKSLSSTPDIKSVLGEWVWGGHCDLTEDNTLLFNAPVGFQPDNIADRRKYFQNKANRVCTSYKTDKIYNFEVFFF